jgi:hypothetical protein
MSHARRVRHGRLCTGDRDKSLELYCHSEKSWWRLLVLAVSRSRGLTSLIVFFVESSYLDQSVFTSRDTDSQYPTNADNKLLNESGRSHNLSLTIV